MKAARYSTLGGPEVLEIVDLPKPYPAPGQIRVAVRAAGVNPSDCKARSGLMGGDLTQTTGREVAGLVDEIGAGVTDVAIGDRVFGFSDDPNGAGAAELALVAHFAPIPSSLSFAEAASLPVALETAARSLDALVVGPAQTLLISGASGGIGSTAVQLAVARGARVIGTASPANQDYLRALGAEAVVYGERLTDRVRELSPDGVDVALDVAGSGVLSELVELAGGAEHVVTLADFPGAKQYGVKFSTGEDGRALDSIAGIGALIMSGRFTLRAQQTFPLHEIATAHRLIESGRVRGKIVLLVG